MTRRLNNSSQSTLLRQWQMLALIPRAPSRKSTGEIARELEDKELGVSKRTVERDLERLSQVFLYTSDEVGRTLYWYYPEHVRSVQIPAMTPETALVLRLTERMLTGLLPRRTLRQLSEFFDSAKAVLHEHARGRLKRWDERVVHIDHTMPMAVPEVEPSVRACVYDGVLKTYVIAAKYTARGRRRPSDYLLHPVGLVIRDGVTYLVAMVNDYEDLRHFALHRMSAAESRHEPARQIDNIDFSAYVEESFAYPISPRPIKLTLRVGSDLADHLAERPLSADQLLQPDRPDSTHQLLTATVADNEQLRWWLGGLGSSAEVVAPPTLRKEFVQHAARLADMYPQSPEDQP